MIFFGSLIRIAHHNVETGGSLSVVFSIISSKTCLRPVSFVRDLGLCLIITFADTHGQNYDNTSCWTAGDDNGTNDWPVILFELPRRLCRSLFVSASLSLCLYIFLCICMCKASGCAVRWAGRWPAALEVHRMPAASSQPSLQTPD